MGNLFYVVFFVFLIFLGVIVPKLLIGISLALNTIDKAKEEIKIKQAENDARIGREIADLEKQKQEYKEKNSIRKLKQLNKKIRNLQKNRERFRRRSDKLIRSYGLLNYKDGILFPGIFILFSVMFEVLGSKCEALSAIWTSYSFVVLSILIAFFRVLKCFNVIREAKARVKDYEKERITDAFHKAFEKRDGISKS